MICLFDFCRYMLNKGKLLVKFDMLNRFSIKLHFSRFEMGKEQTAPMRYFKCQDWAIIKKTNYGSFFYVVFLEAAEVSDLRNKIYRFLKQLKGRFFMKHVFYDVKTKSKIEADVVEKVTYGKPGNERYAFRGKTADGRDLTAFVKKDIWSAAKI